jgi:regulator of sigma E protease
MFELSSAISVLKVVLGFGLVIFIHEFGHFIVARHNGVLVEKFSIGFDFFGARLATWKRGDTTYVLGAFPLGGYVKMLGMHDLPGDEDAELDPRSFQAKSVGARTGIISAGVIANFLSAFVLCYIALLLGHHGAPAVVGSVGYGALEAGLRPGDELVSVADRSVSSWNELMMVYVTQEPGGTVPVRLLRGGEEMSLELVVHRNPEHPFNSPDFSSPLESRVGSVGAGTAADEGGIEPGDLLLSVGGEPVTGWGEFQRLIQHRPDQEVVLTVVRGEGAAAQTLELSVRPSARGADGIPRFHIGWQPEQPSVLDFVEPGSPAEKAGLQVGDRVLSLGGIEASFWYSLWRTATWELPHGEPTELVASRAGTEFSVEIVAGPRPNWGVGVQGVPELGIAGRRPASLEVGAIDDGSAAARAGLRVGDQVIAVRGDVRLGDDASTPEPYEILDPNWDEVLALMGALAEPTMVIEVERGAARHLLTLQLAEVDWPQKMGFLGVSPVVTEVLYKMGPVEALLPAVVAPFRLLQDLISGLRAMFQRRASARLISGPVGILQATYSFAEKSTGDLLNFLALLSVNLAVVNFLPIPITDGGHFVFLMYEKAKGRKMDQELEARFQWAGLVFILLIFLFATFNDVGRIFGF